MNRRRKIVYLKFVKICKCKYRKEKKTSRPR